MGMDKRQKPGKNAKPPKIAGPAIIINPQKNKAKDSQAERKSPLVR